MKVLVSEHIKECYFFEDRKEQNVAIAQSNDYMRSLGITPHKMAKDMRDFILRSRHRDFPFYIDNHEIGIIAINEKYPECLVVDKNRISNNGIIKDRGYLLKTVKGHHVFSSREMTDYLYFPSESSALQGANDFLYNEFSRAYRRCHFIYKSEEVSKGLQEEAYYYTYIVKADSYYNYFQITLYEIFLLPRHLTEFEKEERSEKEFYERPPLRSIFDSRRLYKTLKFFHK